MNILLAYVWSPYTTAAYYAKAFRALGHDVRTVGPVNERSMWLVPIEQCYRLTKPHDPVSVVMDWHPDLAVWIEAGGDYVADLRIFDVPTAAYFIDTHTRLEAHKRIADRFDYRFCAQRQYADALGATWLPVACDPDVHTPTRTGPPEYDVAFVGNTYGDSPMYARRREVLDLLAGRYKCNFQSGVYFEDMANVYASARVAFNVSTNGDLNMRVFEAMCSGRPLATDDVDGLDAIYAGGRVGPSAYLGLAGAYELIDDLLGEPASAAEVGEQARENILARHTYVHRAAQMLQAVGL